MSRNQIALLFFAFVTALIGFTQAIFNAGWVGQEQAPFAVPQWVSLFEICWGFVSFAAMLLSKRNFPSTLLAGSYVVYAAFALLYTLHLASDRGTVTEAMVPEWWKILAVIVGIWFCVGSWLAWRAGGGSSDTG